MLFSQMCLEKLKFVILESRLLKREWFSSDKMVNTGKPEVIIKYQLSYTQ